MKANGVVSALLLASISIPAHALASSADSDLGQVRTDSSKAPEHGITFRGHRYPETQSFIILQTGMIYLLDADDDPARLTIDLGVMRNLGPNWAVGINGHVESGDGEGGAGVMVRGRRWLGRSASLDVATGFLSPESEESYTNGGNTTSWISQAHLNLGNAVSLMVQMDRWKDEPVPEPSPFAPVEASGTNWYVGGTVGYLPGVIALLAFGTLVAATW